MTIYEKTFDKLVEHGFTTYPPATHKGDCLAPYVVIKNGVTSKVVGTSSTRRSLMVLIYVPSIRYTDLEGYKARVKAALEELYPELLFTGNETQPFLEEGNKSWNVSLEYRYTCRERHVG